MRRSWFVATLVGVALVLPACGSVRTDLPASVRPPPPLDPVAPDLGTVVPLDGAAPEAGAEPAGPETTASAFKSPGEKHPLPGGTLAASYPRVGVRPPKGVAPAPAGQAWAVVNVRFCAAKDAPIGGGFVDPGRFRVEVPGQGSVAPAPDAPALAKAPLAIGTPEIAPGTCVEGSIAYLVAGEGHIEAVTYDTGAGLLRWAT